MDISKVISDAVDNASYQTSNGMIDLEDPNHLFLVRGELKKHLDYDLIDLILEAINKGKVKSLSKAAIAMDKTIQLNVFLKNASSEAAGQIQPILDILEKEQTALESKNKDLQPTDVKYKVGNKCQEFFTALGSVSDVTKLASYFPAKGIMKDIFDLEKPLGKGEMWTSVMVQGVKISGTGKSWDVTHGSKKYEVKEQKQGDNTPVRLGVHAALTQFDWWSEIKKINNVCAELNKMDLTKMEKSLGPSSSELIKGIKGVLKYTTEVDKGAFSERDYAPSYHKFLLEAKNFGSSDVQGYTQVELTGPNRAPVIRSIVPLDQASISTKGPLEVELLEDAPEDSAELIKTKLNSLKYVRADDPVKALKQGQQDSISIIAKHYSGVTFMIFRSGTIDFVDPNKFYYKTSTQGKVKITYGKAKSHI